MALIKLFIRQARRRLFRPKVADFSGACLTGGQLLTAVLVLRTLLRRAKITSNDNTMIGILLPPSVGGLLANVAVSLSGKVAVNLNYALSDQGIQSCIDQCGISHVLTSRRFIERKPMQLNTTFVFLEDLRKQATWFDKLLAAAQAYGLPSVALEWLFVPKNQEANDLMAILFTSGTTGQPKGVMLSQQNVFTAVDVIAQKFRVDDDVTLGILPFFHAFGYSGTLWLPLATDMMSVYHFDPFGTKTIGKLASTYQVTVIFATPTLLKLYIRRCEKEDFPVLDLAVVGAEKLTVDVAIEFQEKFGATAVEGYGATELSPWAAVNVPPHRAKEAREPPAKEATTSGLRLGSVGRALPGIDVKVVDPETMQQQQRTGEAGLLLVRGPNVMLGYLHHEGQTAAVIQDGWYNTGDFAKLDAEGFIEITGRKSRFSKIGGETVPHEPLEHQIDKIIRDSDRSDDDVLVAVTAVPDAKRGERLVVVYRSLGNETPASVTAALSRQGVPNLWLPRPDDYIQVAEIPLTSMGKVDLAAVNKIAKTTSA